MITQIKKWISANFINPFNPRDYQWDDETQSKKLSYFELGNIAVENGSSDSAISNYSKAIKERPYVPMFYIIRGIKRLSRGESHKGIRDFNKAIQMVPSYYNMCDRITTYMCSEPSILQMQLWAANYIIELGKILDWNDVIYADMVAEDMKKYTTTPMEKLIERWAREHE